MTDLPDGADLHPKGKPRFLIDAREKDAHVWNRDKLDWYVEEPRATTALLAAEEFHGSVLDPACGGGNIVRGCLAAGLAATGSDIMQRVPIDTPWFRGVSDFRFATLDPVDNIICNPPFFRAKGTEAFIRKALTVARRKVAMFVSLPFLAGSQRARGLFYEHRPLRAWMVTPRVSCPPGEYIEAGGKIGGGTEDWVWLIWRPNAPQPIATQFLWLEQYGLAETALTRPGDVERYAG